MVLRRSSVTALAAAATVTSAGLVMVATSTAHASTGSVRLAGSAAAMTSRHASAGAVPAGRQQTIQVWLRPDLAGATRFADTVSTPGHAAFHHYLSPQAYTQKFGASAAQAKAVQSWLSKQGLSHVRTSAQRDYVTASGSTAAVNKAFQVKLNRYRTTVNGKATTVQSNDRDVAVPAALAPDVLSVTGLNNTAPSTYRVERSAKRATKATCSKYWGEHVDTVKPAYRKITKASLAVCGYSAKQLRAANGATSRATGKGQTIALIEVGQPTAMAETLRLYAQHNGLAAPKSTQFQQLVIGSGGDCSNDFDGEEQLDAEAAYAMAPDANQLMVDGDSCNEELQGVQALFDAELAPLTGNGKNPLASIESNSWGIPNGESAPLINATTAHAINLRAAGEGVGMYFATGDSPGSSVPATDPYSLAVGGTSLGIGAKNQRLFETGWSNDEVVNFGAGWIDDGIGRDAAGGGISRLYGQPAYQKGVVPASMSTLPTDQSVRRTTPDIAADADANTGILQGTIEPNSKGQPGKYETSIDGGTSLSTPLVAGLVADAQQGQKAPFGFVNKAIYALYKTAALHDPVPLTAKSPSQDRAAVPIDGTAQAIAVLDAELPAYTDQVTRHGYDTMTGVGTPNGSAFISALRKLNR